MFNAKPQKSHRPRRIQYFAWVAAALLMVMVLAQLFKYEDFPTVMSALVSTNNSSNVEIISALIVTGEVLALPYLLAMRLSVLMRIVSGVIAGLVSLFWFFIALTSAHAGNSGLMGDTIVVPGGIGPALITFILTGCTMYALLWSIHETSTHPLR